MKNSGPSSFLGLKKSVSGTYIDVFTNTDGFMVVMWSLVVEVPITSFPLDPWYLTGTNKIKVIFNNDSYTVLEFPSRTSVLSTIKETLLLPLLYKSVELISEIVLVDPNILPPPIPT